MSKADKSTASTEETTMTITVFLALFAGYAVGYLAGTAVAIWEFRRLQ